MTYDADDQGPMDRHAAFAEFTPDKDRPVAQRYQSGAPELMRVVVANGKAYHRHGNGVEEFYDLRDDPRESHDLATTTSDPSLLGPYRKLLKRFGPSD